MDLYLDKKIGFEKIAAEVSLPEDAGKWPQEIMQELFKQVPYVADFHPDVNMETVNAEQGYGFGHFEVQNKSEAPTGTTPEQEQSVGIQHVRIPIIVKDFKLQPFDVLVTADSKMLPLTESRLRQALFRPQAFDVTSRTPGDQSMIGQLYPPYRQNYGFGGGGGMGAGADVGKTAAAKTAEEEKAALSGATMASYLKKQTDPQGLANASKSLIGRGTQKILEGGEAAKRGRQLVNAGNVAAQKVVQSSALEEWLGKEAEESSKKDLAQRIADSLGVDPKSVNVPSKPVPTLGVQKEAAPSYPVSDGALRSTKIKDVVPKMPAQEKTSMLQAIRDTVYMGDYEKMAESIGHPDVAAAYAANGAFTSPALNLLAKMAPIEVSKTASAFLPAMRPDVVQLERLQDGYLLKTACSHAWAPQVRHIDRGEALRIFNEKIVLAADATGSVTLEEGPNVKEEGESPADVKPSVIGSFGLYKVQAQDGRELVGFVIPNLIDADGTALPIALFTNGSEAALQAEIVGEPAGAGGNLPTGPVDGHGTFYRMLPNGVVEATVPMTIHGGVGTGQYMAQTFDGRTVTVAVQPNVKRPVALDDTLILPEGYQWCPMGEAKEVQLVAEPGQFHKTSEALRKFASVTVRAGSEHSFSFTGLPLSKLASEDTSFLPYDNAVFLLAALGADTRYASEKLAEALVHSAPVEIRIGRHITPIAEKLAESKEAAARILSFIPQLKVDLAKEAAFVPDPTAVDTILSLGFINPENIRTFVGYLPQIEDVVGKLCELLIASRLGVKDLPVGALEKTIRTMEDVVEGLKTMAFIDKPN